MAVADLRPDGTIQTGTWTRTGGSSTHGVLADDSDATYLSRFGMQSDSQAAVVSLQNPTIPTGAKVVAVRSWVRGRSEDGAADSPVEVGQQVSTGVIRREYASFPGATVRTVFAPWRTERPAGGAWTASNVNALRARFRVTADQDGVRVLEAGAEVEWNERPTVTVDPLGTVTSTSAPTVTWTYDDAENDPQEAFRVVVTLDGATVHDSGWVLSTATEYQLPSLENGKTYTVQVTVRQQWSGAGTHESLPDSDTFSMAFTPPAPPDVVAVAYDDEAVVTLEVADASEGSDPAADWFTIEFRDQAHHPWAMVRGADEVSPTAPSVLVGDYEAQFGLSRTYRVRAHAFVAGSLLSSDPTEVTVTLGSSGRWVTDPYDPDGLHVKVRGSDHGRAWEGRDQVHFPAGMVVAVVESEPTVRAETITLWSHDPGEHALLVAMLRSTRTLLYRDRRDHVYFRFHGGRSSQQVSWDGANVDAHTGVMVEVARPT